MASEAVLRRLQRIGQGSIAAEHGLLALAAVLRGGAAAAAAQQLPQLAVNAFLWDTYLKASQPAFFAEVAPELAPAQQGAAGKRAGAAAAAGGARKPAAAATDPAAVREQVKREVAAAILQVRASEVVCWAGRCRAARAVVPAALFSRGRLPARPHLLSPSALNPITASVTCPTPPIPPHQVVGSAVGEDEPLMSAGLDSLGSVEFANVLGQKLGLQVGGRLDSSARGLRARMRAGGWVRTRCIRRVSGRTWCRP